MAFLFMCVYSFSFCVIFCLSLIFNRKCLLAKIQENINFCHLGEVDLFIKGDGHRGTTDEFVTVPFHLVLFSAALVELTNSIPVHSLILSSHLFFYLHMGWSDGAMVLGKLPGPGHPTIWITVGQGPTSLAVGAHGGCLDIFTFIYHFFPLSPSLWETARYRLKYCLKGLLNPKPTNQPKLCLPFLFPFTVPCRIVFATPEDFETWPNHLSFHFLTRVRSLSYSPMAAWIFTSLLGNMVLVRNVK